jgi:hypothetical protein
MSTNLEETWRESGGPWRDLECDLDGPGGTRQPTWANYFFLKVCPEVWGQ